MFLISTKNWSLPYRHPLKSPPRPNPGPPSLTPSPQSPPKSHQTLSPSTHTLQLNHPQSWTAPLFFHPQKLTLPSTRPNTIVLHPQTLRTKRARPAVACQGSHETARNSSTSSGVNQGRGSIHACVNDLCASCELAFLVSDNPWYGIVHILLIRTKCFFSLN